ncbi:plant intracellular Ras-group-related LRR protein 6-like [Impatiens glandulifera]|uniref:plant intracellular Ras-group-related LRR protein 6-like n=1 Tax=Impatiens glandulifera TaxID=253017 RepID=UPI001FB13C70|nr:plant intracellular Ras-group-related LRR protein 6-like [Impatiens glandulifera]
MAMAKVQEATYRSLMCSGHLYSAEAPLLPKPSNINTAWPGTNTDFKNSSYGSSSSANQGHVKQLDPMLYEQRQQQSPMMKIDIAKRKHVPEDIKEVRLQIVNLRGMSLKNLPDPSLINIGAICKLDLSNNNLQNIPESVTARLLNLIILDVHSNQLKSLPNSIGCLSKLKVLNVTGNLLKSFPRTIENCRSLEEISANFNKLIKLPETIGYKLVNLKKLSVNANKLMFLPNSITHLINLQVLDVRLNCLRSLPDDLENLINLEILDISQNFHHLETLPYSLGLLLSLIELDVSYNKIIELPESISYLRKLRRLSVEGNPLVHPPIEVCEHGFNAVKQYLTEKNGNGGRKESPRKKTWLGKMMRWGSFNGGSNGGETVMYEERRRGIGGYAIDGFVSRRYLGMSFPRRMLCAKTYFTKS